VPSVTVHPEVEQALREGRAVVALESAVITHGLPREPMQTPPGDPTGWDANAPLHLETARAMQRAVRNAGAVPATVAVIDGELRIGLDDEDVQRLASDDQPVKASVVNLAHAMDSGATAGTTVSATIVACGLPDIGPIRFFATGGIGGIHAGWMERPDVSADLRQLATSRVCVVCAGAKSILDVPATVEALEALGVPVIGFGTEVFPLFHARGGDDLPVTQRLDDPAAVASVCRVHWQMLRSESGILVANPIAAADALGAEELKRVVAEANRTADDAGVSGPGRTPFLLTELARLTDGRSLRANVALLLNNARLAGRIAVAWQVGSP
jgi:pseudouridine-5'-phosphate glycosidase